MSNAFAINTNIQSQQAFQNLSETNDELSQLRQRLTTGLRINEASDDAAGFEIANQLEARTGAQGQALRNIGDSKSLLSTAEGSLDSQLNILQTMKEKATQAANDSLSTSEREAIQGELNELTSEVQDIAKNTTFNGKSLIDSGGQDLTFQTGADENDTFEVSLQDSTATGSNLSIGKNASELIDGSSNLQNASVDDQAKIDSTFSLANGPGGGEIELVGSPDGGSTTSTIQGLSAGSNVLNSDGQLANLDGGEFNLKISKDGSSGLNFEVNGDSGNIQNIGSGNISSGTIGSSASPIVLETDSSSGDQIQLDLQDVNADAVKTAIDNNGGSVEATVQVGGDGVEFKNDVAQNETQRENAISNIDTAIDELTSQLSDIGATQNRLSFKESNLETTRTNLNSAQSRIEDADFAQTQTEVAKLQVQQQSGTAQLAQANAAGQSVLSLLGG